MHLKICINKKFALYDIIPQNILIFKKEINIKIIKF